MTTADTKIPVEDRDWTDVGEDDANVAALSLEEGDRIRDSLDLQMISIRLQRTLIKDLKFIATAHGIGYQPLIRDILSRFVVHEKKLIISEALARKEQDLQLERQKAEELELKLKKQKAA